MTKYYNFTFKYYLDEIVISKAVTDNMEERKVHKAGYAASYFNEFLKENAGYKKAVAFGYNVKEVSKSETVSKKATLEAMEKAYDHFVAELENGTLK